MVTEDTGFFIGSITKVFIASLIMQLVEQGVVTLERSLRDLLPEFDWEGSSNQPVTLGQLLCHSSGIDGDFFTPVEAVPPDLADVIAQASGAASLHPPGQYFSYCNLGYQLLARVLEVLCGQSWSELLYRRLLLPLDLHTATLEFDPELTASGHYWNSAGTRLLVSEPGPWSNAPSGTRLSMCSADLARFAQHHLGVVKGLEDPTIIGKKTANLMLRPQLATPFSDNFVAWALGWSVFQEEGESVFGHDGGVAGSSAFLRVYPERDLVLALCVNGPGGRALLASLSSELGCDLPTPAAQRTGNSDAAGKSAFDCETGGSLAGEYHRMGLSVTIIEHSGAYRVQLGGDYGYPPAPPVKLSPLGHNKLGGYVPQVGDDIVISFLNVGEGEGAGALYFQDRIYRRSEYP